MQTLRDIVYTLVLGILAWGGIWIIGYTVLHQRMKYKLSKFEHAKLEMDKANVERLQQVYEELIDAKKPTVH